MILLLNRQAKIQNSVQYLQLSLQHGERLKDAEIGESVEISVVETYLNLTHAYIYLKKIQKGLKTISIALMLGYNLLHRDFPYQSQDQQEMRPRTAYVPNYKLEYLVNLIFSCHKCKSQMLSTKSDLKSALQELKLSQQLIQNYLSQSHQLFREVQGLHNAQLLRNRTQNNTSSFDRRQSNTSQSFMPATSIPSIPNISTISSNSNNNPNYQMNTIRDEQQLQYQQQQMQSLSQERWTLDMEINQQQQQQVQQQQFYMPPQYPYPYAQPYPYYYCDPRIYSPPSLESPQAQRQNKQREEQEISIIYNTQAKQQTREMENQQDYQEQQQQVIVMMKSSQINMFEKQDNSLSQQDSQIKENSIMHDDSFNGIGQLQNFDIRKSQESEADYSKSFCNLNEREYPQDEESYNLYSQKQLYQIQPLIAKRKMTKDEAAILIQKNYKSKIQKQDFELMKQAKKRKSIMLPKKELNRFKDHNIQYMQLQLLEHKNQENLQSDQLCESAQSQLEIEQFKKESECSQKKVTFADTKNEQQALPSLEVSIIEKSIGDRIDVIKDQKLVQILADQQEIPKECKIARQNKIIKIQSLIRGYICRNDYQMKKLLSNKGFIVIHSFVKKYESDKKKTMYFRIKISWITDKNLIKVTLKEEEQKIFTYIMEKMSEKLLSLENNMYQMSQSIKQRLQIMKVKNAKNKGEKLEDEYVVNLIPECEFQSLYSAEVLNSESNFEDHINVVEVDLEPGQNIHDLRRRNLKRFKLMKNIKDPNSDYKVNKESPYKHYIKQYKMTRIIDPIRMEQTKDPKKGYKRQIITATDAAIVLQRGFRMYQFKKVFQYTINRKIEKKNKIKGKKDQKDQKNKKKKDHSHDKSHSDIPYEKKAGRKILKKASILGVGSEIREFEEELIIKRKSKQDKSREEDGDEKRRERSIKKMKKKESQRSSGGTIELLGQLFDEQALADIIESSKSKLASPNIQETPKSSRHQEQQKLEEIKEIEEPILNKSGLQRQDTVKKTQSRPRLQKKQELQGIIRVKNQEELASISQNSQH